MRGPPEAAPALDPELSVGEVSEQVQYKYFSRYRELFLRTTSPDIWTAPDCLTEYLIGDVVSTYWGFLVYAVRRSLERPRDDAATSAFGRLLNPILRRIRYDCDTPIAFRQLRDFVEAPQDTPVHQERRLSYGIHDYRVQAVLHQVRRAAKAIVIREAHNQFEKWKTQGMHPDRTRSLNYWLHLKAELLEWVFRIARVPDSPRSTVIAQHLTWQYVSQLWAREMAGRYSEEVAEAFSRGSALLPPPLLRPSAQEAGPSHDGPPPPRIRPYMLTAFIQRGQLEIQHDTLLEQFPVALTAGRRGPTLPLLGLERRELAPQLYSYGHVDMQTFQPSDPPAPDSSAAASLADEPMETEGPSVYQATTSTERDQATGKDAIPASTSVSTSTPRDVVISGSGGQSPQMIPQLDRLLANVFASATHLGQAWAGRWTGAPPRDPESPSQTRRRIQSYLSQMQSPLPPHGSSRPESYYQTPLWTRIPELIQVAEAQDRTVEGIDMGGVVEAMIQDGELSRQQHALLIELWIWKYGTSLFHFPAILEQYILAPIRRAHPSLLVPHLPWLYWRAHPAVPRAIRFSLRAWFVRHFGPPSPQVQAIFTEGELFVREADLDTRVAGPATSVYWPIDRDLSMQYVDSWITIYQQIRVALETGGDPNMEAIPLTAVLDETPSRRLLQPGYAPTSESGTPSLTFEVAPLRYRDSRLAIILSANLGLPAPEPLRVRQREGGQFPRTGDYEADLGPEELPTRPAKQPDEAGISQEWNIDPFHLLPPRESVSGMDTTDDAESPSDSGQPEEEDSSLDSPSKATSFFAQGPDKRVVVLAEDDFGGDLRVTVQQPPSVQVAADDEDDVVILDSDEEEELYEDDPTEAAGLDVYGFDTDAREVRESQE